MICEFAVLNLKRSPPQKNCIGGNVSMHLPVLVIRQTAELQLCSYLHHKSTRDSTKVTIWAAEHKNE